jgi:hypothetical protein
MLPKTWMAQDASSQSMVLGSDRHIPPGYLVVGADVLAR